MGLAWRGVVLGSLACFFSLAQTAPDRGQAIFNQHTFTPNPWNFTDEGIRNSTSHLIFDTVKSLLQHWPNTRYRNGHSLVPGTVPIGTLLYHGTYKKEIPKVPEWTATDPEHSYLFCRDREEGSGCWHLTMVVTRPLKVLYFDGSSAAKMQGGPMDSQDLLVWGEVRPDWTFNERKRIDELCEWGKQYELDGFVRMEMDFEIMLCDFSAGVKPVTFLNLLPADRGRHRNGPVPPPTSTPASPLLRAKRALQMARAPESPNPLRRSPGFRVIEAGSWHNRFPGETRIRLDYSRLISFYDDATFPSLHASRLGMERWDHRLGDMSAKDVQVLLARLDVALKESHQDSPSGIDWPTLFNVITDRYAERLEVLRYILNTTCIESEAEAVLKKAHTHLESMLNPYVLHSAVPPDDQSVSSGNYSWAAPVFQYCATTHTSYLEDDITPFSKLISSERLLLKAFKDVSKEICRVIVGTWAQGVELGLADEETAVLSSGKTPSMQDVLLQWKIKIEGLMDWLDWSYWVRCRPACGYEEICYLPTWPFFMRGPRAPRPGGPRYQSSFLNWVWARGDSGVLSGLEDENDWEHPQPRCIRRVEPFAL